MYTHSRLALNNIYIYVYIHSRLALSILLKYFQRLTGHGCRQQGIVLLVLLPLRHELRLPLDASWHVLAISLSMVNYYGCGC